MALHINLYHEVQRERVQRQRDPLKLATMGIALVAVGFVLYYLYRLEAFRRVSSQQTATEAKWNAVKPAVDADKAREAELNQAIAASEKLTTRIETRFYWAPLLQEILQIVPRNVQVLNFEGHLIADKPGACSLTLSGIGAGPEPRQAAEDLRTAFVKKLSEKHGKVTSVFNSLDDGPQVVRLENKSMRTANFGIHIEMDGVTAAPQATPDPSKTNRRQK